MKLPIPTLAGGSGEKNFVGEEKSEAPATLEAQEWTAAKKILAEKLSNGNFEAWIAPLIFEKTETGAILRVPNKFFQSWLSEHYDQKLSEALKVVGILSFKFELMTVAQQEEFENKSKIKKLREMPKNPAPVTIDPDTLTPPEQFQKLYEAYPRKERFVRAREIFLNLLGKGLIPKVSELIQAAKKQSRSRESWQRENGRFVPQLHRWLAEGGWAD